MVLLSNHMPNKYEQNPEIEIDLHGKTMAESKVILDELIEDQEYVYVRVIVGKGAHSANGPVLPHFVRNYLTERNIRYNPAKLRDGGEGALEVFLR